MLYIIFHYIEMWRVKPVKFSSRKNNKNESFRTTQEIPRHITLHTIQLYNTVNAWCR